MAKVPTIQKTDFLSSLAGAMTLEVQTLEVLTLEVFSKKTLEAPTLEAK